MTSDECSDNMKDVFKAFSRKPDDEITLVYYQRFRHLNAKQWAILCEWAITTLERFPTVSNMYRAMYEHNMVKAPSKQDLDGEMLVVVCRCGASFAVPKFSEQVNVLCPGDGCKISYDVAYIRGNIDQYNVLWADEDTRAALTVKTTPAEVVKLIAKLISDKGIEPKPVHVGGISERMKIAAMMPDETKEEAWWER